MRIHISVRVRPHLDTHTKAIVIFRFFVSIDEVENVTKFNANTWNESDGSALIELSAKAEWDSQRSISEMDEFKVLASEKLTR